MSSLESVPLQHFLVVERLIDGTLDWNVIHDPRCPKEPIVSPGLTGHDPTLTEFVCNVGASVQVAGDRAFGTLPPPGTYPVTHHYTRYRGGPWGAEEWDSWLELGEALDT